MEIIASNILLYHNPTSYVLHKNDNFGVKD